MAPTPRFAITSLAALAFALALVACMAKVVEPQVEDPVPIAVAPPHYPAPAIPAPSEPVPVEHAAVAGPVPYSQPMVAARAKMDAASPSAAMVGTASGYYAAEMEAHFRLPSRPLDRENYAHLDDNPIHLVSEDPVSTFSVDVDTGSYSNLRRMLEAGALPPADAVRTEELINYFSYGYPLPEDSKQPFSVRTEVAPTPWNPDTLLVQVGIKGYAVPTDERPPANLVFLIDVSGSMQDEAKLALLKPALAMFARTLRPEDKVSIVVYAGASGLVLAPTSGAKQGEIEAALQGLEAGGSTNGGDGIRLAYAMARQGFIKGGINRVVLATDGDFNVGTVSFEALVDLVKAQRASGITLTTLGVGTGNYNDRLMEQLADAGNGNYAYLDSLKEARKVLVEQVGSTLQVIAGDVKAQLEFNPQLVAEYRLIGYENRVLRREDFNNDQVDAGDIGAGHTVTALYEVTLVGSPGQRVDALRYGKGMDDPKRGPQPIVQAKDELAFLKLRYKRPGETASQLIQQPIRASAVRKSPSEDLAFAAAVAAFGQKLRGGEQLGRYSWQAIEQLARGARGADPRGERGEFLGLVGLASSLTPTAEQQAAR